MQAIAMIAIGLVGILVISFWAIGIAVVIRSGKSLSGLFKRKLNHPYLSIPDSIDQYGDDQIFPPE